MANPNILFRFFVIPVYIAADPTPRWQLRPRNDTIGYLAQTRTTTIGTRSS